MARVENSAIISAGKPSKVLRTAAFLAVLFNLGILLYFAAVSNMWEDEVHTFYLSHQPLPNLLELMNRNFHEDAPAFNFLQHGWQKFAQFNPFLLRLLPFTLWVASLACVGLLVNQLAGKRAMYWALIITALWPYHWTFPISYRWYSLATLFGISNLYFFVRLIESQRPNPDGKLSNPLLFGSLVALTGAALWYTVYYAPAIAVGELAVLVVVHRLSLRTVGAFAIAWLGAAILYLPWLSIFLAQLGQSAGGRYSIKAVAASLYVFWAGDFSIPTTFWISLPFLTSLFVGVLLAWNYWPVCRIPLLVAGTILVLLLFSGTIATKRLLLMTTLFAAAIGMSISAAIEDKNRRVPMIVIVAAGILALVSFGGSLTNVTTQSGWITYRWMDEVKEAVRRIESEHPEALVLSNSDPVAFYAHDPSGFQLAKYRLTNNLGLVSDTKVWNTQLRTDPQYSPSMERAISSQNDVIYVHQAFFNSVGTSREMESVLDWLEVLGFDRVTQWQLTRMQGGPERFLSRNDYPPFRVTVIHLRANSDLSGATSRDHR